MRSARLAAKYLLVEEEGGELNERRRGDLLRMLEAGLEAADPARVVSESLQKRDFSGERVFVLAVGKAAEAMALAAEAVLGESAVGGGAGGLVVTKDGHEGGPEDFETLHASHPEPDERGVAAARRVREAVEGLGEGDTLLALVSGGASALLADPEPPVEMVDLKELTSSLLKSGADIGEINCVRKHVSTLKGGGLASLAAPAKTLALLLSDVVGDDVSSIASGLTAPDPTTVDQARSILSRYGIEPPENVTRLLEEAAETPKPDDPIFEGVENEVCGGGRLSVEAAARQARQLGYAPLVLSTTITGDALGAAAVYAAVIREIHDSGEPESAPCAIVSGGETTVVVRGEGVGGPNQEFSLALAAELEGLGGWSAFAIDTDGNDGPTDAAGGLVDGRTAPRMREAGMDPQRALQSNDSYATLKAAGALVKTGPTGTNVNDLRVALVFEENEVYEGYEVGKEIAEEE